MRMDKTLLLGAALVLGSIVSLPRLCAEGSNGSVRMQSPDRSSACADRYNALLGQAKASLVKGDRGAAINSLISAKIQLRRCQELEDRTSGAVAVALNPTRPACVEWSLPHVRGLQRPIDLRRIDLLPAL
jgi:hypothetical protein